MKRNCLKVRYLKRYFALHTLNISFTYLVNTYFQKKTEKLREMPFAFVRASNGFGKHLETLFFHMDGLKRPIFQNLQLLVVVKSVHYLRRQLKIPKKK